MNPASDSRKMRVLGAGIAQLVERNLAKVEVAGSNPVSRSNLNGTVECGRHASP